MGCALLKVGERSPHAWIKRQEVDIMHCSICGQEADNSEDLARHMEKMHALEDTDKPEEEETPESPSQGDVPEPRPIIPARM